MCFVGSQECLDQIGDHDGFLEEMSSEWNLKGYVGGVSSLRKDVRGYQVPMRVLGHETKNTCFTALIVI